MTGIEIAALAEAGLELIVKIAGLVQAAQKGDVVAAEVLKSLTDHDASMKSVVTDAHKYLDEQFDAGGEG